jgi:hypothetical protein
VAAWVSAMFGNFYLVKNYKIADYSATTKSSEKISEDFKSLEFYKFFNACLTKFKNPQFFN